MCRQPRMEPVDCRCLRFGVTERSAWKSDRSKQRPTIRHPAGLTRRFPDSALPFGQTPRAPTPPSLLGGFLILHYQPQDEAKGPDRARLGRAHDSNGRDDVVSNLRSSEQARRGRVLTRSGPCAQSHDHACSAGGYYCDGPSSIGEPRLRREDFR